MILVTTTETYVNGELTETSTDRRAWHGAGEHYHARVTSPETLRLFRTLGGIERATYGYTLAGYIVTRLTSISPDKSTKTIYTFRIIREGEN